MPQTTIEETIDRQFPPAKPARHILPALFRRRLPAGRNGDIEKIDYIPETGNSQEPNTRSGGKPPYRFLSFLFIVIAPFVASVIYFGFIASDQYVSEARFAVRNLASTGSDDKSDGSGDSNGGGGGSILNMRSATQDAYVVTSFINSTEILKRIGENLDYRSMFARDDADFLSRFHVSETNEQFLKYWEDHVSAYIDVSSGIITLKVRTFAPDDSVKLSNAIIHESESLINELSQRARNDIVQSMQADVERNGKAYGDTLAALNTFQHESGILSPETQAKDTSTLLTGLLAQKLDFETRLFVMKQSHAEGSPTYQQLTLAQQSLDEQIDKVKTQLTGPENASIAKALLDYSKLETNREVAEKLYEASQRNYDAVLAEALRKSLYLAVFVNPALPDESTYPHRFTTPLLILLATAVFWTTLSLIWASIKDHQI